MFSSLPINGGAMVTPQLLSADTLNTVIISSSFDEGDGNFMKQSPVMNTECNPVDFVSCCEYKQSVSQWR